VVDAQLVDPEHGWVVTELPDNQHPQPRHLWWTADGGKSWKEITPPVSAGLLRGVTFADGRNGWAAETGAQTVTVWRTSDGGGAWSAGAPTSVQAMTGPVATELDVLDAANMWDLVDAGSHAGFTYKRLLGSHDGGATWKTYPPPYICGRVRFVTARNGYSADEYGWCGDRLLETRDGGTTWSSGKFPALAGTAQLGGSWLPWIDPANPANAIVARIAPSEGDGPATMGFYSTQNAGDDWKLIATRGGVRPGTGILPIVLDARTWLIWTPEARGAPSSFEMTEDSGRTWERTVAPAFPPRQDGFPPGVSSSSFSDDMHGWVVTGYSGCRDFKNNCYVTSLLFATADGGRTWRFVAVPGQRAPS
jgi:photosystem II stability/assembly factor-like uncharacterized protein